MPEEKKSKQRLKVSRRILRYGEGKDPAVDEPDEVVELPDQYLDRDDNKT